MGFLVSVAFLGGFFWLFCLELNVDVFTLKKNFWSRETIKIPTPNHGPLDSSKEKDELSGSFKRKNNSQDTSLWIMTCT